VLIRSFAVGFVIEPTTFVNVAVGMNETAFAIGLVVEPVAFVFATIAPELHPAALAMAVLGPLADVNCFVIEFVVFVFGD